MSKLIIVEGVDSSGKSSLARRIAHTAPAVYMHASGHKSLHDGMFAHHHQMLQDAMINLNHEFIVVMDRHWLSEYCYASVLRPTLMEKYNFPRMLADLGKLEERHSVTYIHCASHSWTRYSETHADHDHSVFKLLQQSEYEAIHGEYVGMFQHIRHVPYVLEEHGLDMGKFCEEVLT